jgi:tetratricopeptide (TPR) repeat protein
MKFFQKHIIWVLFIVIAVGEVGYYFFLRTSPSVKANNAVSIDSGNVAVTYVGGESPWEIPAKVKAIPQPDISLLAKAPSRYPEFYRISMEGKVKAATTLLKDTPYDFTQWANLAVLLENFDSFAKAEEIWKYLITVHPEESFYYSRIASLYHFSLKDYPKAVEAYTKSLSLNNKQVDVYHSFHDLYKFIYKKDIHLAIRVVEGGLKYNKENLELLALVAEDYKELGDTKKASAYYTEAIGAATAAGNFGLVEQLKNDRASLK